MKKHYVCNECGFEWEGDYSNTWWWKGNPHCSRQCYKDAVQRWIEATKTTTTLDAEPDAQAVRGANRAAWWGA